MFWVVVIFVVTVVVPVWIIKVMMNEDKEQYSTLSSLQGGAADEYHYLTSSEYSKLVDVYVCKYCETLNFSKTDKCSHCFAPVKKEKEK